MNREFKDKVVMITGAAGGLGQAFSRAFGRAGAKIGLTDLDQKGLNRISDQLSAEGIESFPLALDVTDEEACRRAVTSIAGRFGRLDVLINNAGISHRSAFAKTQTAVYRKVMDINFFGSLCCAQAALDHLIQKRGLIIVISSLAGFAPLLGRTGYAASKHALHGLFDSLRAELSGTGVGVLLVCPGFTATNIDKSALDSDGRLTTHPQSKVGRVATPASVARAVLRAAEHNRRLLVLSRVGRLSRLVSRLCPALYERLMIRSVRSELERD